MSIFYLGKHRKRKTYPLLQYIKLMPCLCWSDIKWYFQWWKDLSIEMIDKWDMFYDNIIDKIIRYILILYIIINLRTYK
jgi:hypothetical protein